MIYFPYRTDNPGIMLRLVRLDPRIQHVLGINSLKYNLPLKIDMVVKSILRFYLLNFVTVLVGN